MINACQNPEVDVYLIGGQSNATGQGYMKNLPDGFRIDTTVMIFYSEQIGGDGLPLTWQPLCQASETPDKFGFELSMGNRIQQLFPERKAALIKHAYSGSNLYKDWYPGQDAGDSTRFSSHFKRFVETVKKGMDELRELGFTPIIRAMVWQQGEGDARDIAGMENSQAYGEHLNAFIHRVREQFNAQDMIFIYGYVIPVPLPRFTGREEVREAQGFVDHHSGNPLSVQGAFVVETDDLPLRCDEPDSPYPDDKVHFNTYGMLELGNRFADKIHEQEGLRKSRSRKDKHGGEPEPERPNIIFLLTDDQRDKTFSIMGHPWVKTPNIDRLVGEGVRFSNTYIAEPTCSPSRVAIFTGMHERKNGVGFTSSYELTEEQWQQTYPSLLRNAGYYTGFIGKFGVEYYTFRGRASEKFDFWRGHDGWTKFFPKDFDGASCTPYHDAGEDIITPIMGESINMFFDSLPGNKPFCLSVSFNVPHGSQTTSMYTGCDNWHSMMTPANENSKLKGHPIYDTLYRSNPFDIPADCAGDPYAFIPQHVMDQDKGRSKTYEYDYNPVSTREHHIRYYQTITGLDQVIGGLMKKLEKQGLIKNTVIIFASDHGLLMGEYGMGGKALLYDLTSKIPCFIYDPEISANLRGKTLDNLVSSLDITKTILDYAGIQAPEQMEGRSLVPLIENKNLSWREEIFLENLYTGRDNPFCEGIRQGNWKYIRMYDGKVNYLEEDIDFRTRKPDFEQLFNLQEDPKEHHNLIAAYEGTEILEELRVKCRDHSVDLNQQREAYKKINNVQLR